MKQYNGINWLLKEVQVPTLVGLSFIICAFTISIILANTNLPWLWDFNVYIKAKNALLDTGSPYYEAKSLRFIYPPSSIFLLHIVQDSAWFKSAYYVLNSALWLSICAFFCKRPIEYLIIIPIMLLAFGKHGIISMFTGNIALLLYFCAALACWLYYTDRISTQLFCALILIFVLIKPFYAEFLIFVWFKRGLLSFIKSSIAVVLLFFALNLVFYPDLFAQFMASLKVENYDTEIFGITLFSHLSSFGYSLPLAATIQLSMIGLLFTLFVLRVDKLDDGQKLCYLFILAVFINPKHITYDLISALPALMVLVLRSTWLKQIVSFTILAVASLYNLEISPEPYFQWWYAFVAILMIMLVGIISKERLSKLISLIANPTRKEIKER